ncbi:MAG: hypothetical protein IPI66_10585 [Chitinophagaceae bacterium]|nr:hypothetical protein [Chitinophagaceae bacterium]MBL0055321.1 hypothetical protein [Chitinophagaceae bacterium]
MSRSFIKTGAYIVLAISLAACSRRHVPEAARELPPPSKTVVVKKLPVPRVISVNDRYARKSVDGRLYYDVDGRRYWRNYRDGKYYLFHRSMYDNPDFKPKQ